ncbi:hypothetical protein [Streptomyces cucumeris]|uniref:hypothetical protein n=1 Tax=Streptomyces cucumeris TaxID=2962890 RepID=UPI003D718312
MPEMTIAPAPAAAVFSDVTLRKAADLAAAAYRPVWTGPSGEESSGESVAHHLEATIALLDKDGWIRTYDHGKDWSTGTDLADDDSMTVKAMLKSLLRLVRDEIGTDLHRTLPTALRHIGEAGGHGDTDTAYVASVVLDLGDPGPHRRGLRPCHVVVGAAAPHPRGHHRPADRRRPVRPHLRAQPGNGGRLIPGTDRTSTTALPTRCRPR